MRDVKQSKGPSVFCNVNFPWYVCEKFEWILYSCGKVKFHTRIQAVNLTTSTKSNMSPFHVIPDEQRNPECNAFQLDPCRKFEGGRGSSE